MVRNSKLITTGEFASRAGIAVSAVTRLIREGKIKAKKKSGKWMIHTDQLEIKTLSEAARGRKPSGRGRQSRPSSAKAANSTPKKTAPAAPRAAARQKFFTVAEFAAMTYLTERGVSEWLKNGLLKGERDQNGQWRIDAANLEVPNVKRLVREEKT